MDKDKLIEFLLDRDELLRKEMRLHSGGNYNEAQTKKDRRQEIGLILSEINKGIFDTPTNE